MCIRCGECFKACPYNVLQPMAFEQGLEGLWTPRVVADHAGCDSSCNACGQVCPTGAIRALPLEEKKVARMGLAIVNKETCLPHADREACQLCVDECGKAGYHAIEFVHVHTEVDDAGQPIAGTGYDAPVVLDDKCVGCGLCQTACYQLIAKAGKLDESAIIVEAGQGREDRLMDGSYRDLRREDEQRRRDELRQRMQPSDNEFFVPRAAPEGNPSGVGESPFCDLFVTEGEDYFAGAPNRCSGGVYADYPPLCAACQNAVQGVTSGFLSPLQRSTSARSRHGRSTSR
jgi:NAD-dependent dihydropyrimidine dehydrogenase PreA subunit